MLGKVVLVFILCASFALMLFSSLGSSAIMDELAHIPSGYAYVRQLDFRLNPEHPPLIKAFAALPLLFYRLNFPTDIAAWTTMINGQWDMGTAFLYGSGNDADTIVHIARLGPMVLLMLLTILMYVWGKELMGPLWGLVPALLVGMSPSFLAHGQYVTTDVGAALGIALATYFFLRELKSGSRKSLVIAGITFGIAELMKFSAVLLIPYFIFLALVYALLETSSAAWKDRLRRTTKTLLRTAGVFVVGYMIVVYPVYFLFTARYPIERQTADTAFILQSFAGGPTPEGKLCNPVRCLADLDIRMAGNPVTRPFAEYMLGVLMVVQRAAGGNTNYFLGQVSALGSRWYFPVVYLLKEPIPVLILVLGWLFAALASGAKAMFAYRRAIAIFADYVRRHFTEFAAAAFVVLYWTYSMKSPLNIGFRHLFPSLPFVYLLAANFWRNFVTRIELPEADSPFRALWHALIAFMRTSFRGAFVLILLLWFVVESLVAAPYFLSYFNEFGRGTWGGYRYVTDSNYDWGQDLPRLGAWIEERPEIEKIAIDYFGGGNPAYYLGDRAENWWSARGNPKDRGIAWFAVSVNFLQSAIQQEAPYFTRNAEDEYPWLLRGRAREPGLGGVPTPDFRAGTSIFIYKL